MKIDNKFLIVKKEVLDKDTGSKSEVVMHFEGGKLPKSYDDESGKSYDSVFISNLENNEKMYFIRFEDEDRFRLSHVKHKPSKEYGAITLDVEVKSETGELGSKSLLVWPFVVDYDLDLFLREQIKENLFDSDNYHDEDEDDYADIDELYSWLDLD